jgi:putative tryptophan/tyrosine transport system substrate-binding protein
MRRREFITLFGGAATTWPTLARAQQTYRLGVLSGRGRQEPNFVAFFDELRQFGIIEGQHLIVDPSGFGVGQDHFAELATKLVASGTSGILCAGDAAISAAQASTRTIPILAISDDMIGAGLVRSLARPGGNITGVSILSTELNGKRLEFLMDAFGDVHRMAALSDPRVTTTKHLKKLQDEARAHNVELAVYEAATAEEIVPAIDAASNAGAQALNVLASPLFSFNSRRIVERTIAARLPAIYQWPEVAEEGGLLAYGPRITLMYRQMARQLIKLIHGAKAADLPVEQPTVFELVANLKTARVMGLDLPKTFLTRADDVIE